MLLARSMDSVSDMNPFEYAIATLHGRAIRDDDLARSFARTIRRKISKSKGTKEWPLFPEDMISMLDKGPLPDLYNAIFYTKYEYGYVMTNSNAQAVEIWSLASGEGNVKANIRI